MLIQNINIPKEMNKLFYGSSPSWRDTQYFCGKWVKNINTGSYLQLPHKGEADWFQSEIDAKHLIDSLNVIRLHIMPNKAP